MQADMNRSKSVLSQANYICEQSELQEPPDTPSFHVERQWGMQ